MRLAVPLALCALLLAAPARAADPAIWSAVLLATKEESPKAAPPELQKLYAKLSRVFGYNEFKLVGQHIEVMDDPSERWLIPSKSFYLRIASRTRTSPASSRGGAGYVLKLELFEDKHMLTRFETGLAPDNPLFIRGPLHGRGQIIIVIALKPGSEYRPGPAAPGSGPNRPGAILTNSPDTPKP